MASYLSLTEFRPDFSAQFVISPMFNAQRAPDYAYASTLRHDGRRRTSRRRKPAGYTIIEVAVVMLIMSIVAAAAVPAFYQSLLHHRLESAARRVKQDLEYLRDTAKATSTTLECEFAGFSYTLDDDAIHRGLDHGSVYTVDLGAAPYELMAVTADLENDAIVFDGFGNATDDGEIKLELGGSQRTIRVVGGTSQIITDP